MAAQSLNVLLFGCGGVGRQLLRHIVAARDFHLSQGLRLRVLGVFDSRFFFSGRCGELNDADVAALCSAKESSTPLSNPESLIAHPLGEDTWQEALSTVRRVSSLGKLVLVDCTADPDLGKLFAESSADCGIVLANKKPLTDSLDLFDKITCRRHFKCESTVGAGLPVITTLIRMINSQDTVTRICGALSGTLGYIMSELQEGKQFSTIVRSARSLGFTEPDPRDDLSGMDVARKALILARLMGWRLNMEDVQVESLYPVEFSPNKMDVESFLDALPGLDLLMGKRVQEASSRGCTLSYVATLDNHQCKVGLTKQPRDSALGRLRGSDNLVEIYSRCYNTSPLVIQGAGAGNDTTAAGVLADILELRDA